MPLWILSLPAGTPKRLGDIHANRACWAPDGERIAYSTGKDLYIRGSDETDPRKLLSTEEGKIIWAWSWSPDGERICYGVFDWGKTTAELWEVDSVGDAPQQILASREDLKFALQGRWTTDGVWLLFSNEIRGGVRTSLWALSRRKGWFDRRPEGPIQLADESRNYTTFTLSPDGKKIFALGWNLRGELVHYRQEIDDWVPYPFAAAASAAFVSYSPDGEWLAYVSYPDCTLWKSRVDGTQKQQLPQLGLWVHSVSWSPNGERIAFTGARSPLGLENRVYWVPKEGGSVQRATEEDYYQQNACWSPKGKLLVSGVGKRAPALRLIDLDTGETEELPDSEGMWECAWSPDGRYIASHKAGSYSVVIYDVDEKKWTPLEGYEGGVLTWSADSQYLHFYRKDRKIYRFHIKDRTVEQVANLSSDAARTLLAAFGTDQWWYGFDPEGSLITLRDLGTTEMYVLDFEAP